MIAPGALVMLTPLVVGILFGTRTLSGILAGALVSGVQMAVSMSNTGGAWDNAKKYVEVSIHCPILLQHQTAASNSQHRTLSFSFLLKQHYTSCVLLCTCQVWQSCFWKVLCVLQWCLEEPVH